ncbi:MAG: hypothetical protein PHC88_05325 [Terrimicrobiaceae bacterium]|nr:hypothetical protein [Terrimicrobiaceae bacterium]
MKKHLLRIALVGLAAAATLLVLFYAWTDWAGARRWKAVEAGLRAKGEPLTIAEIEPQPIPDAMNFAAAPIFAEIGRIHDRKQWRLSAIHGFTGASRNGSSPLANAARKVDPAFAGSDADAARVILDQTAKWKPLLDEVREAARRPGTVWPSDYREGFRMRVDHIQPLLALGQALSVEARAHLELGDSSAAVADFQLILNLASRCAEPRVVISHLLQQALVRLDVEVVRFGLERHAWTAAALETIQRELAGIPLASGLAMALRGERVIFTEWLPRLSAQGIPDVLNLGEPRTKADGSRQWVGMAWALYPAGWINKDRSAYAESLQPVIEWLAGENSNRPESIVHPDETFRKRMAAPFAPLPELFTSMALPALLISVPRAIHAQAMIDEARIACGIERYRLARGSLPATLEALHPEFLSGMPHDPINGGPFHYRVTGADSYILYSVGWNGVDDGGSDKRPSPKAADKAEDWVWKMGDAAT